MKLRIVELLVALSCVIGACLRESRYSPPVNSAAPESGTLHKSQRPLHAETIRIASWNIKNFGKKKLDDRNVVHVILGVLGQFDVVAIQEIQGVKHDVAHDVVTYLNNWRKLEGRSGEYAFKSSHFLGRKTYKEQYAFVYDAERVAVVSEHIVDDAGDYFEREPYAVRFRVLGPPTEDAFTFTLVNIHVPPDQTKRDPEIRALERVLSSIRRTDREEDDVILLGDFNASAKDLGEFFWRTPALDAVLYDEETNATKTKQFDNIFYHRFDTCEYTGNYGVICLESEFRRPRWQVKMVSDHLPIWAEFSVYEEGRTREFGR